METKIESAVAQRRGEKHKLFSHHGHHKEKEEHSQNCTKKIMDYGCIAQRT